jgi:ferritin-like metal-binding protein YciE
MATEKAVRFIKSHLADAIAAEKSFEAQLRGFASEASSDQIRMLFSQHADETCTQYERLTHRLEELGGEPSAGKSLLAHLGGLAPKLAQIGHDTVDRVTQDLMIAYAVENCEVAMYESLIAVAETAGDEDTAQLVRAIQEEERSTAEKVWKLVSPWAETAFKKLAGAGELTTSGR